MDNNVIAAMARWPDAPDVFGWLSLNERGQWRLHPEGDALASPLSPGESIASSQILQFMHRNYGRDPHGQWYFQNGPQRVYVRLDAAPFIFHTTAAQHGNKLPPLQSHNGLEAGQVTGWCLDEAGRLYARAEIGPGLIAGRDLEAVLNTIRTSDGLSALEGLHDPPAFARGDHPVPFTLDRASNIPEKMGFVRLPSSRSLRESRILAARIPERFQFG